MGLSGNANIVIISVVFSALAISAVSLRFYARRLKRVSFGADDYCIIPALGFAVALGIADAVGATHGNLGGHTVLGPDGLPVFDQTIKVFLQIEWTNQLLSVLSLTFTKLSIILFYRRIFRGPYFNYATWALCAIISAWGVSFFFATLFECYPFSQVWTTFYGQPRHCYHYLPMFFGTAVSNMIIDLIIISTPWPMIWMLQMPTRQKVAVTGIFTLGALVCGISIARLVFFVQAAKGFSNAYDVTYNLAPTLYWTQLEGAIAVVSACLPTLRPIFHGFSPESLLGSLRTKMTMYMKLSKSSHGRNSNRKPSTEADSQSLSALTKQPGDAVFETTIESNLMQDLESQRENIPKEINVKKDISSHTWVDGGGSKTFVSVPQRYFNDS